MESQPHSGASTPSTISHQETDTRHLSTGGPRPIPNLVLESKDISDEGETFSEGEGGDGDGGDEEDEEVTPEELIPRYIGLQTQIYHLHPALTAVVTGKKGTKGRKPAKYSAGLSTEESKELKRLQSRLEILSRDPLFDLREAEYVWAEERLRLEKEGWINKQLGGKWTEESSVQSGSTQSPSSAVLGSDDKKKLDGSTTSFPSSDSAAIPLVEEYDTDLDLIGGLFEPPPTEEVIVGQTEERVNIRDFEEASFTGSNFGKNKPGGRAGIGSAIVKKVLEEVCKSR